MNIFNRTPDQTVNEPKTKSINYNFQNMKFFLYCWVIGMEGIEACSTSAMCSAEGVRFLQMIYHSSYMMLLINIIFLAYSYIRIRFVRFAFFLNIVINILYNCYVIFECIAVAESNPHECMAVILVQKSIIFLTFKKELECWAVLRMPLDMASRQANLASNFLFPYLLISSGNAALDTCSKTSAQRIRFLVLFGHALVFIFGTTMNIILHVLNSRYAVKPRNGFKFTIIICTACMLLIYLIIIDLDGKSIKQNVMEDNSRNRHCLPIVYVLSIYPKINILSILSMILLYFFEDEDLIHRMKDSIVNTFTELYAEDNAQQQSEIVLITQQPITTNNILDTSQYPEELPASAEYTEQMRLQFILPNGIVGANTRFEKLRLIAGTLPRLPIPEITEKPQQLINNNTISAMESPSRQLYGSLSPTRPLNLAGMASSRNSQRQSHNNQQ